MESCTLPEHIFSAWNRGFWMCESPKKSNPSLTVAPENCWKLQCWISQVRFERWRLEISRNQAHQSTRLSQAHLLVSSVSHSAEFQFFLWLSDKVAPSTKLEDKLEGIENFQAWKYMIGLILQENDLYKYIKDEVAEPENYWKLQCWISQVRFEGWRLEISRNQAHQSTRLSQSVSPGKINFSFSRISIFCDLLTRWPQPPSLRTN